MKPEAILQQQVCDYLRLSYPDVPFRSDFAAGIKMTMGQAIKHKRLQSTRAWPDLFIAEPRGKYAGMFIELKAAGLYLKDGITLSNNAHIQEQNTVLKTLREVGYCATFAEGFDEAKLLIDKYLKPRHDGLSHA